MNSQVFTAFYADNIIAILRNLYLNYICPFRFVSTFLLPFLINIYQDKELDQNTTSEDFLVV